MKSKSKLLALLFMQLYISNSCNSNRANFDQGIFPTTPVNFSEVNSEFDDYNSAEHTYSSQQSFSLIFSTNRHSLGADFDFISYDCNAVFDLVTGIFRIEVMNVIPQFLDEINSPANELGPYLTFSPFNDYTDSKNTNKDYRFFYSTDIDGTLDINMVENVFEENSYNYNTKGAINKLPIINSSYDDGYPTLFFDSLNYKETLYFTSNRNGNFDIFYAVSDSGKKINFSTSSVVRKVADLCSGYDDKCPYIKGNIMVFTSNRQGGFGGFDLWYSTFNGNNWEEPKNFGKNINTEYDEYRPVISGEELNYGIDDYFNQLMIFSSNRPGGMGGFDLYYVGIGKDLK